MTAAELERLNARLVRIGVRPLKVIRDRPVRGKVERRTIVRRGVGQVLGVK